MCSVARLQLQFSHVLDSDDINRSSRPGTMFLLVYKLFFYKNQ